MMGNIDQQTHGTLEMQAELSGPGNGYVDIAADVQRVPSISIDYGISGAGPLDLVASTGRMTFALNNGQGNSANLIGYYSPDHANCRTGWALGIGVRLVYRLAGVTYYKGLGTVDSIDPISGKYGERKVLVTVVDWMDEAAIFRPNVTTQLSKRVDEIATTLVAAVPRQPKATSFGTGVSTFTYALDTDLNEQDPVLTVLQRLAQSEYGRFYIAGDTNTGGVLTFESRTARFTPTSVATFNDTMISVSAPRDRSLVINRCKATTHPRTVGTVTTDILFTLAQTSPTSIHSVAPGQAAVIEGDYTDPTNRSARVGGMDMTTPVATTDYTMNTSATGGGTDLTALFSVFAEYGSNRVKYTINNGSAFTGYITKLQARGRYLFDYTPVDNISTDSSSIALYGQREIALDMPYESTVSAASTVGDYVLSVWATPSAVAVAMPLVPPTNTDLATMIAREPGHAVTITETVTGISSVYFINHVSMRFEDFQTIYFEWTLQKALNIPVVQARTSSETVAAATSHTVSLPTGIIAGDLLISVFMVDNTPSVSWPAGWTMFVEQQSFTLTGTGSIAYRQADGTEGSSITVTSGTAQVATHVTYRIRGAEDPATRAPEGSAATADIIPILPTIANPPAVTPTGGTKNYLWLAVGVVHNTIPNVVALSGIPPGYGMTTYLVNTGVHGWCIAVSERSRRIATEDPGTYAFDSYFSGQIGFTIAIHPKAN